MKVLVVLHIFISANIIYAAFNSVVTYNTVAITDAAFNIIKSCSSRNKFRTVGIINPNDDLSSKILMTGCDIILIGNISSLVKKSHTSIEMQYKLRNFIIYAFSAINLSYSLDILKSSIWWNFAGRFIIVEKYLTKNNCKNAGEFLSVLWKYNILDGIFICIESTAEVTIFGYNPYNEEAPLSWSFDRILFKQAGFEIHPFTIFKRHLTTKYTCRNIFFEQTSNLRGYPITSNMQNYPPTMEIKINRSSELVIQNNNIPISDSYYYIKITSKDWNNFHGLDSIMAQEFINFHNATAIIKIYDKGELFGAVNKDGTFYGMLKDQKLGTIDMSFNNRFMLRKGDIPLTYPYQQSELTLVTHLRGDMNILMRIITFLNLNIVISIFIICLLTVVFFMYFAGKEVQLAVLDTLQLLLGMSLHHVPSTLPSRIFLCCLMFYYFIISASIQSNMYVIVTIPQALQNIDSLADLESLEYKLYVSSVGSSVFEPNFYKHLEVIENDHCIDQILNELEAACIDDIYYLKHEAARYRLHIMKANILSFYIVHPMRKDWPLSHKLNIFNEKLNEAGILQMLMLQTDQSANKAICSREQKYKVNEFHVMTLLTCNSIFFLWIVSILISTVVFFIELKVFKYNQRNSDIFMVGRCKQNCFKGVINP